MAAPSRRAARNKSLLHPAANNSVGKAAAPPTERFRCPFAEFDRKNVISKTCNNGSPDIRHVKEHIKKHHTCKADGCLLRSATVSYPNNASATSIGFAAASVSVSTSTSATAYRWCGNPLHMRESQIQRLKNMPRRLTGETPAAQWRRMFKLLFPNAAAAPTAPCLPTSDHLKAMVDGMPDEVAMAFGMCLQKANMLGRERDPVQAAKLFAPQLLIFMDFVSYGAEGVGLNSTTGVAIRNSITVGSSSGSITVASSSGTSTTTTNLSATTPQVNANGEHSPLSPGKDSGVDVDMNDMSEAEAVETGVTAMTSDELVIESHATVEKWIEEWAKGH